MLILQIKTPSRGRFTLILSIGSEGSALGQLLVVEALVPDNHPLHKSILLFFLFVFVVD